MRERGRGDRRGAVDPHTGLRGLIPRLHEPAVIARSVFEAMMLIRAPQSAEGLPDGREGHRSRSGWMGSAGPRGGCMGATSELASGNPGRRIESGAGPFQSEMRDQTNEEGGGKL